LIDQILNETVKSERVETEELETTVTTRSRRFQWVLAFCLITIALASILFWHFGSFGPPLQPTFDGEHAYRHIIAQMEFGPRITGTEGNRKTGYYIAEQLRQANWAVEFQNFTYRDTSCRNVVGRANVGVGPVIILGAHYDTRRWADQDPVHVQDPVPGANDGASGVAVLLELARVLELSKVHHEIWLVFFDAEDNGGIEGWDWIVGSTYMANSLTVHPEAVIIVDMVGDSDQQIYFDGNSDRALSERIWAIAEQLGYSQYFIPEVRWNMMDDHTPFAHRGIPAVDIIDFDYPYWHTTADTADKVSPDSLERVGRTLQVFLETATFSEYSAAKRPQPYWCRMICSGRLSGYS
jgi:glutaminyl-peptide cyclotransferase